MKVCDNKNYRPDIDGLRAIAVLAVLFNHINSSLLPGGFVGVDIFFVISGFLITAQIYTGLRSGSFSIKSFYVRRINRILPALLVLIGVCLLVGLFLLSPSDYARLATSAPLSFTGLSNIYFWREYGNYFAGNASEAILLHTWSLGVEEQFYLIWPLFLILIFKLPYRYMMFAMAMILVLAIVFSEYAVGIAASASYYLLPSRFFELMIGGMLSIAMIEHKIAAYTKYYARAAEVVGYLLLFYSLCFLDKEVSFPGFNALLPCFGSALLIFSGSLGYQSKILSNKGFVFLGVISYSLYLWHWPIIAYINYLNISINVMISIAILLSSIVLAWLSWRFIEKPFRYQSILSPIHSGGTALFAQQLRINQQNVGRALSSNHVFIVRWAMPLVGLSLFCLLSEKTAGFAQRFDPMVASYEKMVAAEPNVIRRHCHVPTAYYRTEPNSTCVLGVSDQHIDGLLVGDSYANHFTGMIDVLAKKDKVQIMDYTMDGCPPILGYNNLKLPPSYRAKCIARNKYIFDLIKKNQYQYVILGASWPEDEGAEERIKKTIKAIYQAHSKVIVILNNQHIEQASTCPIRALMSHSKRSCAVAKSQDKKYWSSIKQLFPDVVFIDPNEIICSSKICKPVIDGVLLYRDSGHLNDVGSRLIGHQLAKSKHYFHESSIS